ncbi:uncharacterized protein LOC108256664 isoform X2 [Ictalurus punctatus]|uniref:THAP domain-containing protein 1 n=1 Tax=Ictalurus punctatus TaxID=7998 RepID=A0A2D0PT98_ICTPU|nr:uncharacterized protein LOC108256664 isoform X2 [Ictalurus punctatus]
MAANTARNHCSVPTCTNNSSKQPYLSFHSFPTDVLVRRKWICAIRRDEGEHFKILRGSTYVCSQHFKESDYSKTSGRKRLKHGAVPSRFQWTNPESFTRRNYFGKIRKAKSMRGMNSETLSDHAYAAVLPTESQPFRPLIMASEERTLNSFSKPPHTPVRSQLWQDAQTDQESTSCEEHVIPVVQQNLRVHQKPLKENDEGHLCGDASSSLGHVILTDQKPTGEFERNLFKEEESEGEDYLSVGTSNPAGNLIPVDQQNEEFVRITVKEEEPEDEDYQCGATSSSVETAIPVDQQELESNAVKNDSYLYCSCRRKLGISAPANNEQGDGAAGPFSNCDFLKQLIAAQNSTSRQLAALSSQITEQTLLLKDVLDEMRQRDCKEPTSAPERMKRAHSLAIAKAARRLHNSEKNPEKYDPQTGINSLHNQAVTTHLLKELSVSFADADPEVIKASCKTYYETVRKSYFLTQTQKARWRYALKFAAKNRQRRKRARSTAILT